MARAWARCAAGLFSIILFNAGAAETGVASGGQGTTGEAIESLLAQAETLNITDTRTNTLKVLEQLEGQLESATPEQKARIELLRVRNFALAGKYQEGLLRLKALHGTDLTPTHRLRSLELCANLSMQISEYVAAFQCLNDAMELQASVDDPELQAGIYGLAAYWHSQLGNPKKGLLYGRRSIQFARETSSARHECTSYEKFAQAQENAGDIQEAIHTYQEGLPKCRAAGDLLYIGVMQILLGRAFLHTDQLDRAEQHLLNGIRDTARSGFDDGVLDGKVNYAQLLYKQGQIDPAYDLLITIMNEISERERWESMTDGYLILAEISATRGNLNAAYDYLKMHMAARRRILDEERSRLIAFHEVTFDTLAREQQISLLEEQARVAELEMQNRLQQRQLTYISYGVAVLLVIVLGILLVHATRERRHFRRLSQRDSLTGLYNHTSFFEKGERMLGLHAPSKRPFTLIACDIDYFKMVNDSHGHQAGDHVLIRLASRLRNTFGEETLIGRIGGEEFAVALPGTDIQTAQNGVDHLRHEMNRVRDDDNDIMVTASFGLACHTGNESFNQLRERADQALYNAKRSGRDRVSVDFSHAESAKRDPQ